MSELALIAGIVSAGSSIASGVASITQGRASAKMAEQAGAYNAALTRTEAAVDENGSRRDSTRRIAALRAGVAGQGTTFEGTPLDILTDQVMLAEERALLIRYAGEQRARAIFYGSGIEAQRYKAEGLNRGLGFFGQAGGTLLGTGYQAYEAGLFDDSFAAPIQTGAGTSFDLSPGNYGQGIYAG